MQSKFIICGTQRTGTSLLDSSLNAHPDIKCYSEVFLFSRGRGVNIENSYRSYMNSSVVRRFRHYLEKKGVVDEYLTELFHEEDVQAAGFKLMLGQIRSFPSIADYIRENSIRVVHVVRENALKTYISRHSAKQRKLYHVKEKVQLGKINIPVSRLKINLSIIEHENTEWRKILEGAEVLEVRYEDIFADMSSAMKKIQQFIGVREVENLSSRLSKINPDNLEEVIENYAEVNECLSGTNYEKYLR